MGVETATEIGRKAARCQEEGWEERRGVISSKERLITNTINFYFDFGVNIHYTSWGGEGALMQLIMTPQILVRQQEQKPFQVFCLDLHKGI